MLELGHGLVDLGQAVEGDAGIGMVDVVIPNIPGKPMHHRIHFHVAGRMQGCPMIGPSFLLKEADRREIVLGIKEVGAYGAENYRRDKKSQ